MSLVNPYCTLLQLQDKLRNGDASNDTKFIEAINQASRFIDGWMGRDYYYHDYSSTPLELYFEDVPMDTTTREIFLPYCPVINITEVSHNGTTFNTTDHYRIVNDAVIKFFAGQFPFASRRIYRDVDNNVISGKYAYDNPVEVTGTFGYYQSSNADVPTGIPLEITRAAIEVAAVYSGEYLKQTLFVSGDVDEVHVTKISDTALKILGPQRCGKIA